MNEPDSSNEVIPNQPFCSFEHQGKKFNVIKKPVLNYRKEIMTDRVKFEIIDDQGGLNGMIWGDNLRGNLGQIESFQSDNISNIFLTGSDEKTKEEGHVSGLVRETIAQLLLQDKFKEWRTSTNLAEGGIITYESLLKDPRLTGSKIPLPNRDPNSVTDIHQYIFTKK